MATFVVHRNYQRDDIPKEVLKRGLTLEEARAHCEDPEAASKTAKSRVAVEATKHLGDWFDSFTQEPGSAEITEYLRQWLLGSNHEDVYNRAVDIVRFGGTLEQLRTFVIKSLRSAPEESGTWYASQHLTDEKLKMVDWDEIRSALRS